MSDHVEVPQPKPDDEESSARSPDREPAALPPPDRDHQTIGSVKRSLMAYLLSSERMRLAAQRSRPTRWTTIGVGGAAVMLLVGNHEETLRLLQQILSG